MNLQRLITFIFHVCNKYRREYEELKDLIVNREHSLSFPNVKRIEVEQLITEYERTHSE